MHEEPDRHSRLVHRAGFLHGMHNARMDLCPVLAGSSEGHVVTWHRSPLQKLAPCLPA